MRFGKRKDQVKVSYLELSKALTITAVDHSLFVSLWDSLMTNNIPDLEENGEAEEALNIDLDLYQLEKDF